MKPKTLPALLLGGLLGLGAAMPASAAILSYNFSFTGDDLNAYSGSYSFNDALAPTATVGGVSQYALDSFSFVFGSNTFTAADDPLAYVAFVDPAFSNPLGVSYFADIGGTGVNFVSGTTDISEQDFNGGAAPGYSDVFGGLSGGSIITTTGGPATAVPEPETWLASLIALALLTVSRRRRTLPVAAA